MGLGLLGVLCGSRLSSAPPWIARAAWQRRSKVMNTRSRWLFAVVVSLVALAAWSAGASAGRVPAAEGAASMSYTFDPDAMYRMPTHFGPRTGPRRGPNGETFDNVGAPQKKTIAVSFLTNAEQLAALLPEGFSLNGEPVVTVAATYITEIPWLAGARLQHPRRQLSRQVRGQGRPRQRQHLAGALGEPNGPDSHWDATSLGSRRSTLTFPSPGCTKERPTLPPAGWASSSST